MSDGDLVAFLRARLDEDEAAALAAASKSPAPWVDHFGDLVDADGHLIADGDDGVSWKLNAVEHIARQDPGRTLRRVTAGRLIAGWHVPVEDCEPPQCVVCLEHVPCRTLRALAAVWDDHPDYRAEWKP